MMNFVYSFFSELNRIATPNYEPNDDDIVRARLRTLTITEHRLKFENGQLHAPPSLLLFIRCTRYRGGA